MSLCVKRLTRADLTYINLQSLTDSLRKKGVGFHFIYFFNSASLPPPHSHLWRFPQFVCFDHSPVLPNLIFHQRYLVGERFVMRCCNIYSMYWNLEKKHKMH